jgi:hypothetical protein
MCREVVELAGVKEYIVNSNPDSTDAGLAIVLSETMTRKPAIKVKLNTFEQIESSIIEIADHLGTIARFDINNINNNGTENKIFRKKIKVKVYSNFIRDIILDMGFTLTDKEYDYLVYPDYLGDKLADEIELACDNVIEIPSHQNAPSNPIERAKMRYNILESRLCTKL